MEPYRFPEHNVIIAKNQSEYKAMPAYRVGDDKGTTVVCWKLSLVERIKLLFRGLLWQTMLTFNQPMQPQRLDADSPFVETK